MRFNKKVLKPLRFMLQVPDWCFSTSCCLLKHQVHFEPSAWQYWCADKSTTLPNGQTPMTRLSSPFTTTCPSNKVTGHLTGLSTLCCSVAVSIRLARQWQLVHAAHHSAYIRKYIWAGAAYDAGKRQALGQQPHPRPQGFATPTHGPSLRSCPCLYRWRVLITHLSLAPDKTAEGT